MTQLVPPTDHDRFEELLSKPASWNEIEAFMVKTASDYAEEVYTLRKDRVNLEYHIYVKSWGIADHLAGPLELTNDSEGEAVYAFTEEYLYALQGWANLCLHFIEKKERALHI